MYHCFLHLHLIMITGTHTNITSLNNDQTLPLFSTPLDNKSPQNGHSHCFSLFPSYPLSIPLSQVSSILLWEDSVLTKQKLCASLIWPLSRMWQHQALPYRNTFFAWLDEPLSPGCPLPQNALLMLLTAWPLNGEVSHGWIVSPFSSHFYFFIQVPGFKYHLELDNYHVYILVLTASLIRHLTKTLDLFFEDISNGLHLT